MMTNHPTQLREGIRLDVARDAHPDSSIRLKRASIRLETNKPHLNRGDRVPPEAPDDSPVPTRQPASHASHQVRAAVVRQRCLDDHVMQER